MKDVCSSVLFRFPFLVGIFTGHVGLVGCTACSGTDKIGLRHLLGNLWLCGTDLSGVNLRWWIIVQSGTVCSTGEISSDPLTGTDIGPGRCPLKRQGGCVTLRTGNWTSNWYTEQSQPSNWSSHFRKYCNREFMVPVPTSIGACVWS